VGRPPTFFILGHRTNALTAILPEPIAEQARAVCEPILAADGYELVEVEWTLELGGWILRLYIDKPGGVTIDDCQAASRTVEPALDVENFIEPSYALEVSSPGLERPLRKPADFSRFAGRRAHVRSTTPIPPGEYLIETDVHATPRRNWTGTLRGYHDGYVELDVDGKVHRVPHAKIAKANLELDDEALASKE
jgi:ribosome maturation factor RimP